MGRKQTASGPISIKGTRGDDVIEIGEGNYSQYTITDQQRGFVINGDKGSDLLAGGIGVDRILGGAGYDEIYAQEEDLEGAAANGTIAYDGGLDLDILRFQTWTEDVGIDLGTTNISGDADRVYTDFELVRTGASVDLSGYTALRGVTTSIEGVIGGYGDDYIAGDWGGNYLEGGPGNDYINGERGRDQLVGGEGDDLIFVYDEDLVTGDYTDTVPETFTPGEQGNDTFVVGGGTVGEYFVNTITDFETREGIDDLDFDQLWINSNFQGELVFDPETQTLKYVWSDPYYGPMGEVTLQGLTEADIPYVMIVTWDPATGMPTG